MRHGQCGFQLEHFFTPIGLLVKKCFGYFNKLGCPLIIRQIIVSARKIKINKRTGLQAERFLEDGYRPSAFSRLNQSPAAFGKTQGRRTLGTGARTDSGQQRMIGGYRGK